MRGKPFTKGQIPWNKNKVTLACNFCKKHYDVCQSRKFSSKYCSRICHNRANAISNKLEGKILASKNGNWNGGKSPIFYIPASIKIHGKNCQKCNSNIHVDTHHIDGNNFNNPVDGSNWQRLCRSCHKETHNAFSNRDLNGRFKAFSSFQK